MRIVAITSDLMDRSKISGALDDVEFVGDAAGARTPTSSCRPGPQRRARGRSARRRARRPHRRLRSARRHRGAGAGDPRRRRRGAPPLPVLPGPGGGARALTLPLMVDSAPPIASPRGRKQAPLRLCETAAMADHPMDTTVTDHLLSTHTRRAQAPRPRAPGRTRGAARVPAPGGAVAHREQRAELALDGGDRSRQAGAAQGALRRDGPARTSSRRPRRPPIPRPGGCTNRPSTCWTSSTASRCTCIPCVEGRLESPEPFAAASFYGSILPAVWSFMLAARSRGLGTAWTTLHLANEAETAELLGIPDGMTQVALIPVGLLHRRRLQARGAPAGRGHHLLGHVGRDDDRIADRRVTPADARVEAHDALCRVAPRDRRRGDAGHHLRRFRRGRRRPRRPGRVGPAPRRRPGRGRRAAGPRRRARRPRRRPRPDLPRAGHRDPGDLAGRRHRRGAAAADAAGVDRGVRRPDPAAHRATPTPRWWWSTATLRRSSTRRAERRPAAGRCSTSSPPTARGDGEPRVRRVRPTTPTGWRSCSSRAAPPPTPKGVMLPDRCVGANIDAIARRRAARPRAPTARCRGCRSTTTWASSVCS